MEWVNDNVAPTYLRWQVVLVLSTAGFVVYATLAFLGFYVP